MKTLILAALLAVSAVATGTVAKADTFAVHGYQGNSYGN
jgi:hypothetical protein